MRHFPDFLDAYAAFARDEFCPRQFHYWTGVSIIGASLERKVWIPRGKWNLHPNLYVLLVAKPGIGKSSAGNIGAELLRQLGTEETRIKILASQNSQASFIDQFTGYKQFYVGEKEHTHSSAYFYASEGSNSLAEIKGGGTIIPVLTDFYDCPGHWDKVLMMGQTPLRNVCCNMLACVTFSFLEQLVPQREAEGGFASRLLFVLQDEVLIRKPLWDETAPADTRDKLLEDLNQIYAMSGPFRVAESFKRRYEAWFPLNDEHRQGLKSERMQHFLARKHTNVLKLCMICAASESSDMILETRHWERALKMIEVEEAKLPTVIKNSSDKGTTSRGLNYNIMRILKERGGATSTLNREQLFRELIATGADMSRIDSVMQTLQRSALVMIEDGGGNRQRFRLTGNPEDYI